MEKADAARMLTLVGVVYNVLFGLRLGANAPTVLSMPPFRPWDPLIATLFLLIEVGVLAGSLLLPCIAYYRITRAHHRSAGILLIIGGAILTAAVLVHIAMVVGAVLFLAAGALALVSHPGEVAPTHVAESILPVNR